MPQPQQFRQIPAQHPVAHLARRRDPFHRRARDDRVSVGRVRAEEGAGGEFVDGEADGEDDVRGGEFEVQVGVARASSMANIQWAPASWLITSGTFG